jgi:3-hydroxyisobutyrate dehydrogenase-like beta-hydroxyacid dehydrogenase
MSETPKVGLVGLGLIGTALAKRLRASGFQLVGTDVDSAAMARFAALGGRVLPSAAEVAAECARMLVAVFDTDQVEEVVTGKDGVASAASLTDRRIVLVASTCDPDRIARLAERIEPQGVDLLEIPLSGSSGQVAAGEAVALVGGEEAVMEQCRDILAAIAKESCFMGLAGAGGRAKLAINLILGLNRAALAEGLVYAERMGLEPARFLEVARGSAAYSQVMDVKGDKMVAGDFAPQGRIVQSSKDFALILESAAGTGLTLPLARAYQQLMAGCMAAGEGDWDNSAVIQEIRRATPPPA